MMTTRAHRTEMCGQTLVLAVVLLGLSSTLLLGLFKVSVAAKEKIRLQLSADLAVLSTLNCQANGLNSIALANRAILANDALAAQLNALVSEITFYRRLVEKFKKILRFIPYAGTASTFVAKGIQIFEKAIKRTASLTLPPARYSNSAMRKSQEAVRYILPIYSLKAARLTLEENVPEAQMTALGRSLQLRQTRSLQKAFRETEASITYDLREKTMDRHTLSRNWGIKVAGLSPIKKIGGTTITPTDLAATDSLRLKVFKRLRWRWKTVLHTRSNASDFGYHPPAHLLSMEIAGLRSALNLPILVSTKVPEFIAKDPFQQRKLFALSAGRLLYRRPSREGEGPNLFNPFWEAQLSPVADDPTARSALPEIILNEVRH